MLCIYCLHSDPNDCKGHLEIYMLVLVALNTLLIILCFVTSYISSRGTILNGNARRPIPLLLYLRCPLILFEIAWTIVGTCWISNLTDVDCEPHVVVAVKFTVVISWLMLVIFLWGVWLTFDPLGGVHHKDMKMASQRAKKLWKLRLQCLCLCASRDDHAKGAFEDVAQLMTDFFQVYGTTF